MLLRHLLRTIGTAALTLSVLFLLSHAAIEPTTLLQNTLDSSARPGNEAQLPGVMAQLLHRYGLDAPLFYVGWQQGQGWQWHGLHNQYHTWLTQLVHGNLGYSYRADAPVTELMAQALRYTLPLTLLAATLSVLLALSATMAVGFRPVARRWFLRVAHVLQGLPLFLLALGLLLLLANPDAFDWFPAFGLGPDDVSASSPVQLLYHLALPTASLVLGSFPGLAIQLDGALQQELTRPYIATARAKGASANRVIWQHALRNALLPVVTLLTDLLPAIVAGAVVVEVVFALPGMGRLITDAAVNQDIPVLLGTVGLVAVVRLLSQLAADVLYPVLDPRLRSAA
ncbi:ABC transporter permease [Hymenobacter pini]|uniref:ABC transporter permease n=1 Tax=Hymenobacter pini TaxID=2880879 RepID=UPI001CF3EE07|nr:ABC transporter permease [Hymenobacter pini]MCA8831558.1 ABC transporter permease [Hymenobacter pini]